ncbi:chorismate synthase [Anaerovorax odorimutans]|uniref:chorismate synthase n=1 Tax=Anaerovorax odorimutans TaxID=109327 RepID=UPI0004005B3D|nr:chorismate synthase [Anaerovorax odorimutans]
MGSTWGNNLKISIFGESHGMGIGAVIDGFPAGFSFNMENILKEMDRRAPGKSKLTTGRREKDLPNIVSGVLDGVTTGAPICIIINNTDTKSRDYEGLRVVPRPSHSDYTGQLRYNGKNDIRGGGHFSGRLTAPLVFAGALCKEFLREAKGIEIGSHIYSIGSVKDEGFDLAGVNEGLLKSLQKMNLPVLDEDIADVMKEAVDEARIQKDSIGGIIECAVTGICAGIGSPMFENVESRIASILYGIPAVKGIEFGEGFEMSLKKGSEVNDCFSKNEDIIVTKTNYNGGILGGITTGMPIVVKVALKPTPSISKEQSTLNLKTGEEELLIIQGRHDPCIALRSPVVIECAMAIAIMDLHLEAYGYDAR